MKNFTRIKDISNLSEIIKEAILLKMDPFKYSDLGKAVKFAVEEFKKFKFTN